MNQLQYGLGTIIEMKKPHPCLTRSTKFVIVKLGADIKIKCMGCGNVLMLSRDHFNHQIRSIISANL